MVIDNKKIAVYDHGKKGKAYNVNGLTMAQCEKLVQKLYKIHEKVKTENVTFSTYKDKCYGYILAN